MVNLLISIVLAGFAVTFAIELLGLLLIWFFNKETLYIWFSLPFSFGAMFVMHDIHQMMFVSVPATAFVTLILNKYLNTPTVVNTRLRRL